MRKIDRTGEERINNFGSKMIIKEYRKYSDIDVYFPEYDWTFEHAAYNNFKKGTVKCPYEPRYYNIGYLGEGKYKVRENGKNKKEFEVWYRMLERCYDPKYQEKYSTYRGCKVERRFMYREILNKISTHTNGMIIEGLLIDDGLISYELVDEYKELEISLILSDDAGAFPKVKEIIITTSDSFNDIGVINDLLYMFS